MKHAWGSGLVCAPSASVTQMKKLTSHGEAWQGDWQRRLASELERRKEPSLRAFASNAGLATYADIAAALDGPFAPTQITTAMRAEYVEAEDPGGFATDCLWRYLVEYVAAPPRAVGRRESEAAGAVAACAAALGGAENGEQIVATWRELRGRILEGWLPSSSIDPELTRALQGKTWRFVG